MCPHENLQFWYVFGDSDKGQFVCGLNDSKCQQELLCQANLTADLALQRVRAIKAVTKELDSVQTSEPEPITTSEGDTNSIASKVGCYRCGGSRLFCQLLQILQC